MSTFPTTAADDRAATANSRYLRALEAENDHLREQLQLTVKEPPQKERAYTKELESKVSSLLRSLKKNPSSTRTKARIRILESLLRERHPRWDFENDTSSGDESIHTDSDDGALNPASPFTTSPVSPATAETQGEHSASDKDPRLTKGSLSSTDY